MRAIRPSAWLLGIMVVITAGCDRRAQRTQSPVRRTTVRSSNEPKEPKVSYWSPKTPTMEEQQRNLQSPDEGVRFGAARGLWLKGPKAKEAIPDLINALEDQTAKVRGYAARALVKMGPDAKRAVPALTKMLGDQAEYTINVLVEESIYVQRHAKKTVYVRTNAAEALGSIGPDAQTAIPTLLELLQDSQADVRKAAADALGNLGPAAAEAVPALTDLLGDKESAVRGPAARALGRFGPEGKPAVRALAGLLDDKTKYEEGVNLVYGLGPPLEEFAKTLCVRDNAVTALLQIGPEAALPTLRDLLKDEKAEVRSAAAKALGSSGPKPNRPCLTSSPHCKTKAGTFV